MSEIQLTGLAVINGLAVLAFGGLYSLGGRTNKAWRRWVGGLLFPAAVMGLSAWQGTFQAWQIGALLGYPAALSVGYGSDGGVWKKVARRAIYGLILGCVSLFFAWPCGARMLFLLQVGTATVFSVVLGSSNPTHAAWEEYLIGSGAVFFVPFMVG